MDDFFVPTDTQPDEIRIRKGLMKKKPKGKTTVIIAHISRESKYGFNLFVLALDKKSKQYALSTFICKSDEGEQLIKDALFPITNQKEYNPT